MTDTATCTAAVLDEAGDEFRLRELEIGAPAPGEVRVRIAASGICHTDLLMREGTFGIPMPVVLGHEGAGTVEEVGDGIAGVAPGDRVALSYTACGGCRHCHAGRPYHCLAFGAHNFASMRLDGTTALSSAGDAVHSHFFGQSSFATRALVPAGNLVRLPDDIPFEVVAPFGCGIQTGAGSVLNALRPPVGASIAIFGCGGVGLSALMAAAVSGCDPIIAVDIRPARLDLARELGATHTIDAGAEDPVGAIQELTAGGAEYSLETSGVTSVLRQSVECLIVSGTCGVVGAPPLGAEVSLDVNHLMGGARTVRGLVEGHSVPRIFIPQLIELWRAGRLPVDRLVRAYDFEDINQAAHDAETGEVVKPVLRMPAA